MLPAQAVERGVVETGGVLPSAELPASCEVRVKGAVTRESCPELSVVIEEKSEEITVETVVMSVRVVTDVAHRVFKVAATWISWQSDCLVMRSLLEVRAPCEVPASSRPKRSKNHMVMWFFRPSSDLLTLSKLPTLVELK